MLHLLAVLVIAFAIACAVIPSWRPYLVVEREDGSFWWIGSEMRARAAIAEMRRARRNLSR